MTRGTVEWLLLFVSAVQMTMTMETRSPSHPPAEMTLHGGLMAPGPSCDVVGESCCRQQQQMQQQRASLKRHATAGSWVSALVPPGPAATAPQAAAGTEHQRADVRILLAARSTTHNPASCQACTSMWRSAVHWQPVFRLLQGGGSPPRRTSWHQHHERQQQQQEQQGVEADARIAFGDLEVHRQVGSGQFGVVRLVRHTPTGRLYALKVGATLKNPRGALCGLYSSRCPAPGCTSTTAPARAGMGMSCLMNVWCRVASAADAHEQRTPQTQPFSEALPQCTAGSAQGADQGAQAHRARAQREAHAGATTAPHPGLGNERQACAVMRTEGAKTGRSWLRHHVLVGRRLRQATRCACGCTAPSRTRTACTCCRSSCQASCMASGCPSCSAAAVAH